MARRRYTRARRERRSEERAIETMSFGLIIVLFAVGFLFTGLSTAWITLIAGAIFTGAAVYQSNRRWRVNPMTWIGGIFLLIAGFLSLQTGVTPGGLLLPIGVVALVIAASFVTGEF
jgi:hypothetical protein